MAKKTLPSAAEQTVSDSLKARATPSATHLKQAAQLFDEIASLASRTDRDCFYRISEFDESDGRTVPAEQASLFIEDLRDVIRRVGWMADLGSQKLTGHAQVRGDVEEWLLSPSYPLDVESEAAND